MLGWFKKKLGKKDKDQGVKPEAEELEKGEAEEIEEPEEQVSTTQPDVKIEEEAQEQPVEPEVLDVEEEEQAVPPEVEAEVEVAPPSSGGELEAEKESLVVAEEQEPAISQGETVEESEPEDKPEQAKTLFQRLQERLGKTRDSLVNRLDDLFAGKKVIDQELLDELEEILITADLGVSTALELLEEARAKVSRNELSDPAALKTVIKDKLLEYLLESDIPAEMVMPAKGPFVIMVVGVNGVGKTTSIGKIAAKFKGAGRSVLLVAGDTFRAAAIDQLKIWGDRINTEVVAGLPNSDPSSVIFDGIERAVADNYDVVIIDTAGRLHTKVNLMEELKKIKRVITKKIPDAPHETMMVLDATTGQNAISQAKLFHEAVELTGLTLTKLDGTAKGGIVANICRGLKIPVRFIGIGEQVDDLRDFEAREFIDALFGDGL
ncbi:MAG: signal recognition particle-docking protein FtsY [Desulfobulbaceae bacterium]|nr:signal recognition particle-docking protein FtsY [Desulfobulbaceae bacterium]